MYGGRLATSGQFKAIVFIFTEWTYINYFNGSTLTDDQKCGGSIISRRWVLTAAHCLPEQHLYNQYYQQDRYKILSSNISVSAGCVYLNGSECQHRHADRFIPHEAAVRAVASGDRGFWPGVDVALLHMETPFVFGPSVAAIALLGNPMPYKLHRCYALGYGDQYRATTPQHVQSDEHLHFVPLAAGNRDYCRRVALRPDNVRHFHVCAHNDVDERMMSCAGDSGSPLVCGGRDMVMLGVLGGSTALESDNIRCGDREQADLYTATFHVKQWIRTVTGDRSIVFRRFRRLRG